MEITAQDLAGTDVTSVDEPACPSSQVMVSPLFEHSPLSANESSIYASSTQNDDDQPISVVSSLRPINPHIGKRYVYPQKTFGSPRSIDNSY